MIAPLVSVGNEGDMAKKRTQELFHSSSLVGEMDWEKVFLFLKVAGSSFTCVCTMIHDLLGDIENA